MVNYRSIFITLAPDNTISNTAEIYHHISTLGKTGPTVNYCCIFITLAPDKSYQILQKFTAIFQP
jgi:hypothetical protein